MKTFSRVLCVCCICAVCSLLLPASAGTFAAPAGSAPAEPASDADYQTAAGTGRAMPIVMYSQGDPAWGSYLYGGRDPMASYGSRHSSHVTFRAGGYACRYCQMVVCQRILFTRKGLCPRAYSPRCRKLRAEGGKACSHHTGFFPHGAVRGQAASAADGPRRLFGFRSLYRRLRL